MRILHIVYEFPIAGNAAYRYHKAMLANGVDSTMLSLTKALKLYRVESFNETIPHLLLRKLPEKIQEFFTTRKIKPNQYYFHKLRPLGMGYADNPLVKEADVIYMHWIERGSSAKDLEEILSLGKPIIFVLHDMWAVTGGCHQCFDCDKFRYSCGNCNMFYGNEKATSRQLSLKGAIYGKYKNVCFLSPSHWMQQRAMESSVTKGRKVFHIPNLLDDSIFKPMAKSMARSILNLPQDKIIISFGCQSGTRLAVKGWSYLREAINLLSYPKDKILLLVFGSDKDIQTEEEVKYSIHFFGPVFDEHKLMLIANAATVFVSPTLSETFGYTLIENILCNTPVVSFDNTAIPEMVKMKENGYLAKNKDSKDLAAGIEWCIANPLSSKSHVDYSTSKIVEKHLEMIHELLS